ncbi:MAG TPA: tRNA (cytidine(34)-2'-O)-methyltransferase [Chthoniobacterales bacterium]|jgi:tRNA (cytidine/uridine-2'-O-)-methyltransferase|nr:tRNA (cytidine(34)-2'-O)-methyltransferase [Chthoniobacterales bacterium]
MFNLVLVEPEIPPNTGNIARLAFAAGSRLHLVKPLGFSLDDRQLRRAGMDYWREVDVTVWENLDEFETKASGRSLFFSTKSQRPYWEITFNRGDSLIFGRETKGLPESLLVARADDCYTIPMAAGARSLNLATAVAIVLFEGIRQLSISA